MTFQVQAEPEARVGAWVTRETAGARSVLDLGCGRAEYLTICSAPHRCGIDVFEPYITECRERLRGSGMVFECGDVLEYRSLTGHPHECVLLIDVIEHLSKANGLKLLRMLQEDVQTILVFTPMGWHEQDEIDGNPAQRHISAWLEPELTVLGFDVIEAPNFHHGNPHEKRGALFGVWRKR